MNPAIPRRRFVLGALAVGAIGACSEGTEDEPSASTGPTGTSEPSGTTVAPEGRTDWFMPAEETEHERTWMCWPSNADVWGDDLEAVQDTIEEIALAIAEFEPVTMLCRPDQLDQLAERTGGDIELLAAPVDDLWARDTLPCLLVSTNEGGAAKLAAGRFRFNGWGGKQLHDGDTQLAAIVAQHLGIELIDSGLVGEGGGLEVDGEGTVLASRSSWVNDNRNPGRGEAEVEASMLDALGAERVIWVDGLAGADITDGHIDTLARFAAPTTIVVDLPAFDDPDDPWVEVAESTRAAVAAARTVDGEPYEIVEIVQPEEPRGEGDDFLATYMNYYVCNGAVIAPEFGDTDADEAAHEVLQGLFPDREIVMINIDAVAAGGGGIHCATQQQPKVG